MIKETDRNIPNWRKNFIVGEAIVLAVEAFSRLPDEYQPYSDMCDLKELLTDMDQPMLEVFQRAARELIDVLQGRTAERSRQ
jgi:hypothetical protein